MQLKKVGIVQSQSSDSNPVEEVPSVEMSLKLESDHQQLGRVSIQSLVVQVESKPFDGRTENTVEQLTTTCE